MDRYYQTDGMHTYMVLDQIEILQDSYEIDMVTNNDFDELLSFDFRMLDNRQQMYYKIDGLMEMNDLLEGHELECKWVIVLMDHLLNLIFKLYDYLLSSNDLILELDSIFYNQKQQTFHFLYLPGYNMDVRMQIKELMENLLRIVSHKERKGVDFIYGLYELLQQERYDLENMRNYIKPYLEEESGSEQNSNKAKKYNKNECGDEDGKNSMKDAGIIIKNDAMSTVEQNSFERRHNDKEELMGLLFSPNQELQRNKKNKKHRYKPFLLMIMGITILAGIVWIYIELRQYKQLYHMKSLMSILVLIAVEIFLYMGVDKENSEEAIETDRVYTSESKEESKENDEMLEEVCTTVLPEYGEETDLLGSNERGIRNIPKYRLIPERKLFAYGTPAAISGAQQYLVPITIDVTPITIGRDPTGSDHCISNNTVSRKHAKFYRQKEEVLLEDFNSTNGTFVNDVPVLSGHPVTVSEGDNIRFGAVSFYMERESL